MGNRRNASPLKKGAQGMASIVVLARGAGVIPARVSASDPQRPQKENRYGSAPRLLQQVKRSTDKPPSSIAMGAPLEVGPSWKQGSGGPGRPHEQSFSATLGIGGQFAVSRPDSVVVLDSGAAAKSVCFKRLDNHNLLFRKFGLPEVLPYSATARSKFGDGRMGEVKHAADIMVGIAGCKGALAGFAPDADIPAFLRKGALEALGGQLEFEHDILTVRKRGVLAPLRVNAMGHYVLRVVEFSKRPPCSDPVPNLAASYFE